MVYLCLKICNEQKCDYNPSSKRINKNTVLKLKQCARWGWCDPKTEKTEIGGSL